MGGGRGGGGVEKRTRSGYGCNELWVKAGSMSQSCCRDGVIEQQVSDLELSRSLPDRENVVGGWGVGWGCNQERRDLRCADPDARPGAGDLQLQRLQTGRIHLWRDLFLSVCKLAV